MANQSTDSQSPAADSNQSTLFQGPSISVPVFGTIPLSSDQIIRDLKIKNNPPLWAQFFKYGVCGLVSTFVLLFIYFIFRQYYPSYIADDLPKSTLKLHMLYVMLIAFVAANFVAYFSNRMFVFTPGRHSFMREMLLFFIISAISFAAGNYAKDWFIDYGLNKDIAALSFAVSSAIVNFIARKYLVFSNDSPNPNQNELEPT